VTTLSIRYDTTRDAILIWGINVVSPEEEKERLQWEGFAEREVLSLE